MAAMTLTMARRGAFAPRVNLELRKGDGETGAFAVTVAGAPAESDVRLEYPEGEQRLRATAGEVPAFPLLRRATFEAAPGAGGTAVAPELKVGAHRVTPDGDSEGLPAHVAVHVGDGTRHFELDSSRGQIVLPLTEASWRVDITLGGERG
jgi:hypothetical protein